jgi:hypothetical protein
VRIHHYAIFYNVKPRQVCLGAHSVQYSFM